MLTPKIKNVIIINEYKILLTYENGEKRVYDMEKNLKYEIYHNLKNYDNFKKLHPAGETIQWDTGEDISPEELYFNSVKA